MKKLTMIILVLAMLLSACVAGQEQETENSCGAVTAAKPVIYLYPEEETEVAVKLYYDGQLTVTYPAYGDGWHVLARPDGTLTDVKTGLEYSYLFWEGESSAEYDLSSGFVVRGEETAEFLQRTLSQMGMTPREYNEFIVYWLPQMQGNAYNLITFQQEAYTERAQLDVSPKPDSVLRVFMVFKPLDTPVSVETPRLEPFERKGFTVVEWGGTALAD